MTQKGQRLIQEAQELLKESDEFLRARTPQFLSDCQETRLREERYHHLNREYQIPVSA